ncbi:YqgE/AlgH family protein [Rhodococcus sp. 27YEA15]|uniref:YqgE/AlgH family protein n=1 Tax=Rhodococcus sp. 27YEA15 TaxID=3156259 RepID=UPI003C7E5F1E
MPHAEEPEDRMAWVEPEVRPGSLLVSSTDLTDPAFRRTVVYMIEHNDAGSLGVVVNRPSGTVVRNVLPQWAPLTTHTSALYIGGPVKRDSALCLGTARNGVDIDGVSGLRRVDGKVVMVDLDSDPAVIAPLVEGIRIFAGYSGWTIGQLDSELERDDWMVISSLPSDVMSPPHVDVWAGVLRRQPLPLSMLASHPIELERN